MGNLHDADLHEQTPAEGNRGAIASYSTKRNLRQTIPSEIVDLLRMETGASNRIGGVHITPNGMETKIMLTKSGEIIQGIPQYF